MVYKVIPTILKIWILAIAFAIGILGLLMTILYAGLWQIVFVPLVVLIYFAFGWAAPSYVRKIVTPFNRMFFLTIVLMRIVTLKLNSMTISHDDIVIYNKGNPALVGVVVECAVVAVSVLVLMLLFRVSEWLCHKIDRLRSGAFASK